MLVFRLEAKGKSFSFIRVIQIKKWVSMWSEWVWQSLFWTHRVDNIHLYCMKGEGLDGNGTCYLYEFDKNKLQDLNLKECMAYEQKFKSSILHSQLSDAVFARMNR